MGDKVFVRVAPYRQVIKFGKKCMGPFEILEWISMVVYQLALLVSMDHICNVFHMLLLCKYISDLIHVLRLEDVEIDNSLAYKECLV